MADVMQFDLVSPESRLASLEATAVQIPGADGDLTAMPDHAPMITTLRPGILTVEAAGGETTQYAVTGGFADVSGPATTVLAERAMPVADLDASEIDALITEARASAEGATDAALDTANKLVADLEALKAQLA